LKERIFGIVNLIVNHILENDDLDHEKNNVMENLISKGYNPNEIIDAFTWIRSFATNLYNDMQFDKFYNKPHAFRILSEEERMRFTVEAWGFLIKLRELGIIDDSLREEIINKALLIIDDEVDLDDIMIVASLAVFRQSYPLFKEEFLDQFQHGKNYLIN